MLETKQLPFVRLVAKKEGANWRVTFEDIKYSPGQGAVGVDGAITYKSSNRPEFSDGLVFFLTGGDYRRKDILLSNTQWEFIKNPIGVPVGEVRLPFVTLTGHKVLNKVRVTFSEIKYKNNQNKLGRHGLTHFYQNHNYSIPFFNAHYAVSYFYLPTIEKGDTSLVITEKQWETIVAGENAILTAPKDCYIFDSEYSVTCKEQALSNWETAMYKDYDLNITGVFNENFLNKMREFQAKIPEKAEITLFPNHINVKISAWWRADYYFRVGFLMLAIRIAQKREELSNSVLKKRFERFVSGDFTTSEVKMSGAHNWKYIYQ